MNRFVGSFLNMAQIQELVTLFKGSTVEPVVKFICTYGLRRSEALGLCWDKVDFDNNQFTICRAMIQGDGENYIKDCTKNDSSYRTLPMTADMREMLLELKAKKSENQKLFGASYVNNILVFTFPDGYPITPNYLMRTFHDTVEKSDLHKIRLHDLRHSVASNLLAKGISLVDTQLWLGHSQPSTTLNYYAHTDSSSKRNIQLLLDEELNLGNDNTGDPENF
ncbi:MAG: site-specific integrase [Acutalibacteraceae bacterium]